MKNDIDLSQPDKVPEWAKAQPPLAQVSCSAKCYFVLPPELGDGQYSSVMGKEDKDTILECVKGWLDENDDCPEEEMTITTKLFTKAEIDALPDI